MYDDLATFVLISCCISIVSTTFVIYSFIKYRQLRVTEFKYILYICFADLMFALIVFTSCICKFAHITYNTFGCKFQATIKVFFATQEFIWTAVVCFTLKESVFKNEFGNERRHRVWFIFSTLMSLILCLIPLITDQYGQVQPLYGSNCFVNLGLISNPKYQKYQLDWTSLGIFYIPLWISFVYNLNCIISVVNKIKLEDRKYHQQQINALYLYPSVFFFCWIWISVDRILAIFNIYESIQLAYIDYGFTCLNGFCNSLIYGCTQIKDRTPIEKDFRKLVCGEFKDSYQSLQEQGTNEKSVFSSQTSMWITE